MSAAVQHRIEVHPSTNPLELAAAWQREAEAAGDPNAGSFVLATVAPSGQPSARVLLLKGWVPGGFRFFTNYRSPKARDIEANRRAAAVFFYPLLERQVRVEGTCTRLSHAESDAYFATRPRESQLGAWASPQSRPIASLAAIRTELARLAARWPDQVPRPPHWGGYVFEAQRVELWLAGPARLNERVLFWRDGSRWRSTRLAP